MKIVEFKRPDQLSLQIEIIKHQENTVATKETERHRHNFHTLLLLKNGTSSQEIDFQRYELEQSQLLFIPAGAVHCEFKTFQLEGYSIVFKDEFFSLPQKVLLDGFLQYAIAARKLLIHLSEKALEELIPYFELLYHEQYSINNQNQVFLLQNLMLALLNKIESFIQHHSHQNSFITQRSIFQQFAHSLEQHFIKEKSVFFYTQHLQINSKKLNEILKSIVGLTAQEVILERVILEAKRELSFTTKSIKEIAYSLGYDNQYYFSRIFKKKTSFGPEEFRKQFAQ